MPSKPGFGSSACVSKHGATTDSWDYQDLFWFGRCPSKWLREASSDGDFFADDLDSLSRTDPLRYQFMIDHALLPNYIDEFGYTHVHFILKYGDAVNPTAKPKSRLSLEALARIREDIISNRVVSDK
ncbi:hypothetical protein V7S43_002558 [Phytophthora oleae]|uniref:Uncharacterized protein n=1 Tax=Phytophthora oleae TaxID=2107226 RepID=A0ABD3G1F9_9STRA